jgi:membrane protein required for colicin V production
MESLQLLDIILVIILIWGAITGFKKGLILSLASFIAIIAGAIAAYYGSEAIAIALASEVDWSSKKIAVASFAVAFIGVVLIVHVLARILEKFIDLVALGFANKISGAIFGMAKNAILLTFLIFGIRGLGGDLIPENADDNCVILPFVESISTIVLPYWEEWSEKNDLEKLEEKVNKKVKEAKDKLEETKEKIEHKL